MKIRTDVLEAHYSPEGWRRYPRDTEFSRFVRSRANWVCERCGRTSPSRQGLHCAHVFSRWIMSTRWDEDNAHSLCNGCHQHFARFPELYYGWVINKIGKKRFYALYRRAIS